jgi:hypothetical protein
LLASLQEAGKDVEAARRTVEKCVTGPKALAKIDKAGASLRKAIALITKGCPAARREHERLAVREHFLSAVIELREVELALAGARALLGTTKQQREWTQLARTVAEGRAGAERAVGPSLLVRLLERIEDAEARQAGSVKKVLDDMWEESMWRRLLRPGKNGGRE